MVFKDEDKYKSKYGIYGIVNLTNGKIYIGQTSETFQRRFWHHNWCLTSGKHHNSYLQNAWIKYGSDQFEFFVIFVASDSDDLNQLEREYIFEYNSCNPNFGYNMQSGGQPEQLNSFVSEEGRRIVAEKNRMHMLGRKHSEETKAKMRASSKHLSPSEETKRKLSEYMSNRVVSEETKEKLRIANTGSNSPIARFTEKDVVDIKKRLMNNETQKSIASDYNVSYGAISAIANGRTWNHVIVDGWDQYMKDKC